MFSQKDNIRKAITLTLAASLAIAVLVGCSNISEPVESDSAAATTTENAEVQNTDVAESQATSLADPALNGVDTTPATPEPEPTEEPEPDLAETLEESKEPEAPEKPSKPAQTTKSNSDSSTKQPKPNYTPTGTTATRDGDWYWNNIDGWMYDPNHEHMTEEEIAEWNQKIEDNHSGKSQLGEGEELTPEDIAAIDEILGL